MQRTHIYHYYSPWIILSAVMLVFFSSTSSIATSTSDIEQWLQMHNSYRKLHGVSPVIWSEMVAASAQAYAETCPSGHSGTDYGENLLWTSYNRRVSLVVQMWYDEETDYNYKKPGFSHNTGHFTQIVWKATTEIGCASEVGCGNVLSYVWVCHYNQSGNYIGDFEENVLMPDFKND